MSRTLTASLRQLLVVLLLAHGLTQSDPASAAGADPALMASVPASAAVVVSTDHETLSKHPHYVDVLKFLVSQGWGGGLDHLSSAGVDLAADAKWTVSYRTAHGGEGLVLKLPSLDGLRAGAKAARGAKYEEGEHDGVPFFSLSKRQTVYDLGSGVILVASPATAKKALSARAKNKVMSKKRGFAKHAKRARGLGKSLWGVAYVPGALRKRMSGKGSGDVASIERVIFGAQGLGPSTLKVEGMTKGEKEATTAVAAIRSKIDRKLLSSAVLRALGVGVLVDQLKLSTSGKRVDASMTLTAPQVGLFSRLAKRLVTAL